MANSLVFNYIDSAKKSALDKALAFIDAIKDVSVISYDDTNIRQELGDVSTFAHEIHIPEYVGELANDAGYLVSDDISSFVTNEELENKGYLTDHQSLDAYAKNADINIHLSNLDASVHDAIDDVLEDVSVDLAAVREELENGMINVEQYADDKVLALNNDLMAIINANKTSASSDLEYAITRARGDFDSSINALDIAKQDRFEVGAGLSLENGVLSSTIDTTLFRIVDELPTMDIEDNKIYLVSTHNSTLGDIYTEHIHTDGGWEKLGEFKATTDLSGYYTKDQVDSIITSARQALETTISTYQNDNNLEHVELQGLISALQTEDTKLASQITEKSNTNATAIETLQGTVVDHKAITDVNTENITILDASLSALASKEASDYATLASLISSGSDNLGGAVGRIQANEEAIAAEVSARQDADLLIESEIAEKFGAADASINSKADQADLDSLEEVVNTKADQSDLEDLASVVDTKAAAADLIALAGDVSVLASQADLDALTAVVGTKALQSDLDALDAVVATKAAQTDVDGISSTLSALSENVTSKNAEVDAKFVSVDSSIAANAEAIATNSGEISIIKNQISGLPKLHFEVVEDLPEENDASTDIIYLKNENDAPEDVFTEYIIVNSSWEKLGTQKFNINNYATISYVDEEISNLNTADSSLAGEISDVASDLVAIDTRVADNKLLIDDARDSIDSINTSISTISETVSGHTSSISTINSTLESHASDISSNQTSIGNLETAIETANDNITLLGNQIDAVEDKADDALEDASVNASNISNAVARIDAIELNEANVDSSITGIKESIGAIETSIEGFATKAEIGELGLAQEASEAHAEYWTVNEDTFDADPTAESNSFEVVNDEASWNESYANGVLKQYYTKFPDEDLISTDPSTPDKTATFNDRIYVGTIGDSETEVRFKAGWLAKAQSITNVEDPTEVYYMERLDKESQYYGTDDEWKAQYPTFHGKSWTLYTDQELTQEAGKVFNIVTLEFDGFDHTYAAWIANGAQAPWICVNFIGQDVNSKPVFKYEGKEDVKPWGDTIFGNGEGQKAWGIESLPSVFGPDATDPTKFNLFIEPAGLEYHPSEEAKEEIAHTVKSYADAKYDDLLEKYNALLARVVALENKE